MPSMLDTPFDAAYAALGLNVLVLDEMAGYVAGGRKQVESQLDTVRTQGRKAQEQLQKQTEELSSKVSDVMPFGFGDLGLPTDFKALDPQAWLSQLGLGDWLQPAKAQETITAAVAQGVGMIEGTWSKVAEAAPAPLGDYLAESVRFASGLLDEAVKATNAGVVAAEAVVVPAAKATKAPGGKARATKASTRKPAAKAAVKA